MGAGTTVIVPQGASIEVYSDGTNVVQTTSAYNNLTVIGTLTTNALTATGTISGAGFTNLFASPPAIGGTTAAAASFTTLNAISAATFQGNLTVQAAGTLEAAGACILAGTSATPITSTTAGAWFGTQGNMQIYCNGTNTVVDICAAGSTNLVAFYNASTTQVGSITYSGTTTLYNTTSDARLKIPMSFISGIGRMIDRLKPRWFMWKECPDQPPEPGFFAQEVYKIWPWAVKKGKGKPGQAGFMPWQMDNAKLIPLLVAEIQELRQRVATLEKEVSHGRHVR